MGLAGSTKRLSGYLTALAVAFAALGGCTMVPDSGPSRRDVESQATVSAIDTSRGSLLDYALVDLNRFVLPWIEDLGPGSLLQTFGAGHGPAPEIEVGVGDTLQVTLFEAQAGGLFIPTDAGSRPGNFVSLPNQTVDARATSPFPTPDRFVR